MDTLTAIESRRSVRKFRDDTIPEDKLEAILRAASLAPSGKNRQPWRFVVVKADKRPEMVRLMREGIEEKKARGEATGSAEWTIKVMEMAPVTVFVFNPEGVQPWLPHDVRQMFSDIVNVQSVGAAIQNMLLAAQDLGLGSLWICDVFSAYEGLQAWTGESGEMIAAVSLGYAAESPEARPRKPMGDVVRYL
jgi:nitroreductase